MNTTQTSNVTENVEVPVKKLRYPRRRNGAPKDGIRVDLSAPKLVARTPSGTFVKKVFARELPIMTFRIIQG